MEFDMRLFELPDGRCAAAPPTSARRAARRTFGGTGGFRLQRDGFGGAQGIYVSRCRRPRFAQFGFEELQLAHILPVHTLRHYLPASGTRRGITFGRRTVQFVNSERRAKRSVRVPKIFRGS
jgi:hypothetical protein